MAYSKKKRNQHTVDTKTRKSMHTNIRHVSSNHLACAPRDYKWYGPMRGETVVSEVSTTVDVGTSCAR